MPRAAAGPVRPGPARLAGTPSDCPTFRPALSREGRGAVLTQRAVPGLLARGTSAQAPESRLIKGSTTIVELLRMFPEGDAARLMARLQLPCAHCGGAFHEPLTMAAQRHRRDPRAVLEAFRALDRDGPSDEQTAAALRRVG